MQGRHFKILALALVVLFAAALRVYDLADTPAGFYCDEAGLGYNAYTIANYGTDEAGKTFPLFFWSFGVSYKNPAFIYAAAPLVKLLGPNELPVRLTSALFGIGTVIAIFFLGRALLGYWVGLFAAFFLAVAPWHLHFSRIGFELISFPLFFVIGLTFFIRFTQGRRTLWLAMLFFGLCFYAYKVANLFVPLFVVGATLLYLPTFFRRWRETAVALVVLAAVVGPVVYFELSNQALSTKYFSNTTHLRPGEPVAEQVERTFRYYQQFFSYEFLFQRGDPIVRHAVRDFGELHPFYLPFLILGTAIALAWRDRATKLVLWWMLLYPLGASLMTEIPSASRGIIGIPGFCLLTGIGFAGALKILGWLAYFRSLRLAVQGLAIVAGLVMLSPEVRAYLDAYWNDYPKYAAPTYGGFQYGYRQAIEAMEPHRDEYDLLMMTAVDVNQPQIFPRFYNGVPPREDDGYLIINPAEFGRYSPDQRILGAFRPGDLDLFSDYEVKETITAPGGQTEFVVAAVRARKRFLTNWLVLGLFENEDGEGMGESHIDVNNPSRDSYQGSFGEVIWRRTAPQFVLVDLNLHFSGADPRHPGNPERVCAYAALTVRSPEEQSAFFEISGTDDYFRLWLNGRDLMPFPVLLGDRKQTRPIDLRAGDNLLVLKSCENVGSWAFKARITDAEGKDLPGLVTLPELPGGPVEPATLPEDSEIQLVEGFDQIIAFNHHRPEHPDYRGHGEMWMAMVGDPAAEVAWSTAPVPVRKRTVFAFTGSTSNEKGEAELYVNGKYALMFELDDQRNVRTWRRGDYSLTFASKASIAGNSGVYLLDVPAEVVEVGKPAILRVIPARGQPEAWFGVQGYRDTVAKEELSIQGAVEALRSGWSAEQTGEAPPPPPSPQARTPEQPPAEATPSPQRQDDPATPDAGAQPTPEPAAKAEDESVRRFVYRGSRDGAPAAPVDETGAALFLPLDEIPTTGPNGEPVLAEGVEPDGAGGLYVPEDGRVIVPDAGDLIGDSGTISFWVEPGWEGGADSKNSLVQLRDPAFWENRVQIFKDGPFLRFLFTPDTGTEGGVGINVSHWREGEPHHVSASWADGLTLLYVDGQLVGTSPYEGRLQLTPGTDLYIGADHPGGIPGADASLRGFRTYDHERSQDEIYDAAQSER